MTLKRGVGITLRYRIPVAKWNIQSPKVPRRTSWDSKLLTKCLLLRNLEQGQQKEKTNFVYAAAYLPQTEFEYNAHQVYSCEASLFHYSVTQKRIVRSLPNSKQGITRYGDNVYVGKKGTDFIVSHRFICSRMSIRLGRGPNPRIIVPIVW